MILLFEDTKIPSPPSLHRHHQLLTLPETPASNNKRHNDRAHGRRADEHEHNDDLVADGNEGIGSGEDLAGHHAGNEHEADAHHGVDRGDHARLDRSRENVAARLLVVRAKAELHFDQLPLLAHLREHALDGNCQRGHRVANHHSRRRNEVARLPPRMHADHQPRDEERREEVARQHRQKGRDFIGDLLLLDPPPHDEHRRKDHDDEDAERQPDVLRSEDKGQRVAHQEELRNRADRSDGDVLVQSELLNERGCLRDDDEKQCQQKLRNGNFNDLVHAHSRFPLRKMHVLAFGTAGW